MPATRIRAPLVLAVTALLLTVPLAVALTAVDSPATRLLERAPWATAAFVVGVVVVGCVAVGPSRSGWRTATVLLGTSYLSVATLLVSLTGTRWAFGGLHSDAGFRTQTVTRYADSAAWADYGYRDLPAYYPPLWPWAQGRVADALDVPAWTVMKPAAAVAAAVVPLVAWLLWRRVLPRLDAALVVAATTLVAMDLQKSDEWLVLACLVPWWLDVVRGVRAPGRRPLPAVVQGGVLGLLLLTHTVFVLPLVLATLLGWLTDLVRRRPAPLGVRDTAVVAVTALVVSAPYWVPPALLRLSGRPADDLQLRWSPRGFDVPPLPLPLDVHGAVAAVAVVWVLLRFRSNGLAQGLGLVLVSGYTVALGGQLLQRLDVAVLPHKAHHLLAAALAAGCVAALADVARAVLTRRRRGVRGPVGWALGAVALVVAVPLAADALHYWATGRPADGARGTRYPDGGYPEALAAGSDPRSDAWDVQPGDPSAAQVVAAWRRVSGRQAGDDAETVLLTVRGDLLGTRPVHGFTAWKSIYSHPNGEFEERVALLRQLAGCGGPACAARLLADNPYDEVHGVVARREGKDLVFPLGADNFPTGWDYIEVTVPERLLREPWFAREDVGPVVVAARAELS